MIIVCCTFIGCKPSNKIVQSNKEKETQIIPIFTPGPQTIVYKTKNDYSNLVPILLSDNKKEIISYPHPSDLKVGNSYVFPTFLKKGYLLDNRGISKNVAFLRYTYEEYASLKNAPTLKELYENIIDKDPLVELCDCGNRAAFTNITMQINKLIDKKKLETTCKKTK